MASRAPLQASDFRMGSALGRGTFGLVYKAACTSAAAKYLPERCQRAVAIKWLVKSKIVASGAVAHLLLRREVEIHSRLIHPSILRLGAYFHDATASYLVLELAARGTLGSAMRKLGAGHFSEARVERFAVELACAVSYLHARCVIHRDIKPENILLDAKYRIKLGDFGWAVIDPNLKRRTLCGTPSFLAPEILARRGAYGERVDHWALGVTLFEALSGVHPFGDGEDGAEERRERAAPRRRGGGADRAIERKAEHVGLASAVYERIVAGDAKWEALPLACSAGARRCLALLLRVAPCERLPLDTFAGWSSAPVVIADTTE